MSRTAPQEPIVRHLTSRVPRAHADQAAGEVLATIREQRFDYADVVWVLDEGERPIGYAALSALVAAPPDARVDSIMKRVSEAVHADSDQEHALTVVLRNSMPAAAVVDRHDRFLGVAPPRALLEITREEHVEDLHRLVGINRERTPEGEPQGHGWRRARDRLPWLLVGLLGSAFATAVVSRFASILEKTITVAFFMPAIVYVADAIGTQTESIVVREVSLRRTMSPAMARHEARTGLVIALALGFMTLGGVAAVFRDWRLAMTVSGAVVASGLTATAVGMGLPMALARAGRDPALGAGPVGTVIQDVLSLLIYFASASLLL